MGVKAKAEEHDDDLCWLLAQKANEATVTAYKRALSSSQGVLRIEDGQLVRVKDGTRTIVGRGEPCRKVIVGQQLKVRLIGQVLL